MPTAPQRSATARSSGRILRGWTSRHAREMERLYAAFSPMLRALGPMARLVPPRVLQSVLGPVEKGVKGTLFGCRMCGECVLAATGMSCPMTCPKQLRNGPCGGVRPGGRCEIEPDMACVWIEGWRGSDRMRDGTAIRTLKRPMDARLSGRSTWAAVMRGEHAPEGAPASLAASAPRPASPLERRLRSGTFCVTAEFNPPDTADPDAILAAAKPLLGCCDAVNVTDGAGGNTHISSLGACALLARDGHDPVMQISCRDRNRIAVQADALGAAALGIGNILCLTGDGVQGGDQPGAKPVFDLDCTSLLGILNGMRRTGRFASGRTIETAPSFHLGATSNPCVIPPEIEVERLAKKIAAGAQFIQTQFCFDIDSFAAFLARFRDRGLDRHAKLLVGIGPLPSAKAARWMRGAIAGVRVPDEIIARLEGASDQRREGIDICVELIDRLGGMQGVAGVHIMAFRQPQAVREIVARAARTRSRANGAAPGHTESQDTKEGVKACRKTTR